MERRRDGQVAKSPTAVLGELPAVVVLDRLPVPVLAIAEDGAIVFANEAFADMVGYSADALRELHFHQIFHTLPADESAVSVMRAHEELVVELLHRDGSIVRARMSKSALRRGSDPVALATFQDLTEQLWVDEL
ncbi:histidine kinase [Mycolicibacterium novocastrense]|uniref:PAS domain-containing protein n=1 Tax=Mycolicibacterium novocastrense TaxID=59813 RepID=A0AAW5SNV0_MYCNV|nr:PAS domain-containing protein [Mycolicibacterium novocastrense]KUH64243.1 histidine kinase [Mycolicibacterium novocastrense]KUH71223.1 histidine kinase [Mycolicibacterium novocastrense]KUH74533.1 histidine kinase [Mycolicibacterium novocastrense]MCV7024894.1 PAS domain-containing protein [Mycolicibacterium novocastrense]